ncbi:MULTISPECIES: hypothetical protein [unclassified Acidocella]|uniref:hypothetical protein n=1 Tax=unclassified Acidocella TaxID=2648610 RepID=UPI001181B37D|nr:MULTISPECIES: hypothetical protein [unclassified Acidocella]WBO58994.1 hypothetical protein GT370_18210 [Acidocella sp. MX-AZ03]
MQISFALENAPDEETRFALDNGLDDFNAERVGLDNADDLWVVARSAENAVLGGLKAKTVLVRQVGSAPN